MDYSKQGNINVVNTGYVHSKVRNFYENSTEIDMYSLGKQIDNMIQKMFRDAIFYSKYREVEFLKSMGVTSFLELEKMLDIQTFQDSLLKNLDIEEKLQKAIDMSTIDMQSKYRAAEIKMTLRDAMTEINKHYVEYLGTVFSEISMGKDVSLVDNAGLSYILQCVNGGKRINVETLQSLDPSLYTYDVELQAAINGMVSEEAVNYVDYVEDMVQRGIDGEGIKSLRKEEEIAFSPQWQANFRIPDSKVAAFPPVHFNMSVDEIISYIAGELGGSAQENLNHLLYALVNIFSFGTSGGISDDNRTTESYSFREFAQYGDCIDVLSKASLHWLLGQNFEEQIFSKANPAILVIGGNIIPMSTVLAKYQSDILDTDYTGVQIDNIPKHSPTTLWEEKEEAITQITNRFFTKGTANYPEPLLSVGSSIGSAIARATKVSGELSINIDRLLNR